MAIPLINTNIVEDNLALLPTQFKASQGSGRTVWTLDSNGKKLTETEEESNVIECFLETILEQHQELENTFFDIIEDTRFKNALGVNLDRYGNLLGVYRTKNTTDQRYRLQLAVEIIKRASDGTPDKIREVMSAITNISYLRYFAHPPSAVLMYGLRPANKAITVLKEEAQALRAASPIEIGSAVYGTTYDFETLWIPVETTSTLKGIGGKPVDHAIYTGGAGLPDYPDGAGDPDYPLNTNIHPFQDQSLDLLKVRVGATIDLSIISNKTGILPEIVDDVVEVTHGLMIEINQVTLDEPNY